MLFVIQESAHGLKTNRANGESSVRRGRISGIADYKNSLKNEAKNLYLLVSIFILFLSC